MARSKQVLNGGQVIVDYLIREKVPYALGLCGHGNITSACRIWNWFGNPTVCGPHLLLAARGRCV